MPHIMHAIIDGVTEAHTAGMTHNDLHAFNIVLDFTKDNKPRVGIIDWGLLLRAPKKRASLNFIAEAEKHEEQVVAARGAAERQRQKRPWLAPELYDPLLADAYTMASDVYALGYILQALHEFWRKVQSLYMEGSVHDQETMDAILFRAQNWMCLESREERKSLLQVRDYFRSLNTEPSRVQRPLVELSVSFCD